MNIRRALGIVVVGAILVGGVIWLRGGNARTLLRDLRRLARTEGVELKDLRGRMTKMPRGAADGTLSAEELNKLVQGLHLRRIPPEIFERRWDVVYKQVHGQENPRRDAKAEPLTAEDERALSWTLESPCQDKLSTEWELYWSPAPLRIHDNVNFGGFGIYWRASDGATCWDATYTYG